ncbi:MAG: response regulator transcription factor [Acidithiobacillus sp.]
MLYALIGSTAHHAAHLVEAFWLTAAARWEETDPLERSRILLLSEQGDADLSMVSRLKRCGALPRSVSDTNAAALLVQRWHPQLLVISPWSNPMGSWCKGLCSRAEGMNLPILAIGPGENESMAMMALDAGADAYLAQPVSDTLLLAQIGALLKRNSHWEQVVAGQMEILQVNPRTHRVWVRGREIHLSRRLFRLLHYLALHPDQTFSAQYIASLLSDGSKFIQENSVAAQIHRLRKALEARQAGEWLETVHGFGYRLTLPPAEKSIKPAIQPLQDGHLS